MRDIGMLYLILHKIYPFAIETVRDIQGDWERLCEILFRAGQKCSKRSARTQKVKKNLRIVKYRPACPPPCRPPCQPPYSPPCRSPRRSPCQPQCPPRTQHNTTPSAADTSTQHNRTTSTLDGVKNVTNQQPDEQGDTRSRMFFC